MRMTAEEARALLAKVAEESPRREVSAGLRTFWSDVREEPPGLPPRKSGRPVPSKELREVSRLCGGLFEAAAALGVGVLDILASFEGGSPDPSPEARDPEFSAETQEQRHRDAATTVQVAIQRWHDAIAVDKASARLLREISPTTDPPRKFSRDGKPLPKTGFDAVPLTWGRGPGAEDIREHGAEKIIKHRRYDQARGVWVDCAESKAEKSIHVGWKGGGERQYYSAPVKEGRRQAGGGTRVVFPSSDKLPCHGSGEQAVIVRSVEERTGKRGNTYSVEVFRAYCGACGAVRDVPQKVAKANPPPKTWEFPTHKAPELRSRGGFVDYGEIVVHAVEKRDRTGDHIVATVDRQDPDEQIAWAPAPACPEEFYGRTVSYAMGAAAGNIPRRVKTVKASDGGAMRAVEESRVAGLYRATELHREVLPVRASAKRATVDERGTGLNFSENLIAGKGSVGQAVTSASRPTTGAVAPARMIRDLAVSDIEAARVKRAADRPVLCDANKAPVRQILAF